MRYARRETGNQDLPPESHRKVQGVEPERYQSCRVRYNDTLLSMRLDSSLMRFSVLILLDRVHQAHQLLIACMPLLFSTNIPG